MGELFCAIRQHIRVQYQEIIGVMIASIFGGIFGVILMLLVSAISGDREVVVLGTLLVAIFGGCFMIGMGNNNVLGAFHLAISMGKTRKQYFFAQYLILMLESILWEGMILLFHVLEKTLYPAVVSDAVWDFEWNGLETMCGMCIGLTMIIAIPALVLFMGSMLLRFSQKFFWTLFGMIAISPSIIMRSSHNPDSWMGQVGWAAVGFFQKIDPLWCVGIGVFFVLILSLVSFTLLQRQQVVS